MSDSKRLHWLEQYGQVPEDATEGDMDWNLAQRASWWGKPLDPNAFWKDRVVWRDNSAKSAARRHGRAYPPLPYEDKNLPAYPNDEGIDWNSGAVEGPNLHFATSSKESAFWDHFGKTMPHPPEKLALEQADAASSIMEARYLYEKGGNIGRDTPQSIAAHEEVVRRRAQEFGCPPEALTENAMFWTYVLESRREYQKRTNSSLSVDYFLSKVAVDRKFVTDPLTEEQVKAANAWKIDYLRRLRREKTDESYIIAYLKAWGLSEAEVFPPGN